MYVCSIYNHVFEPFEARNQMYLLHLQPQILWALLFIPDVRLFLY